MVKANIDSSTRTANVELDGHMYQNITEITLLILKLIKNDPDMWKNVKSFIEVIDEGVNEGFSIDKLYDLYCDGYYKADDIVKKFFPNGGY